jgi:hypothetical protein
MDRAGRIDRAQDEVKHSDGRGRAVLDLPKVDAPLLELRTSA